MKQEWIDNGRLFVPESVGGWALSHAAVPTAIPLSEERWRIYFSARDADNRSHTGFTDLDMRTHQVTAYRGPVLSPGRPGMFDDAGAMLSWITPVGADLYAYYIGWNVAVAVPFRNSLGLAISRDGGESFEKVSEGPVLDRSVHDPCFVASACVLREGSTWRMWYLSCVDWRPTSSGPMHYYHIKYAESEDGVSWKRDGLVCIDFGEHDHAISRPCVIRDGDIYRMWYSHRGDAYRIGYAESSDGLAWTRMDHRVRLRSSGEWDSEMQEYPYVFDWSGKRWMLYNGNGFGATGFGLARLAE